MARGVSVFAMVALAAACSKAPTDTSATSSRQPAATKGADQKHRASAPASSPLDVPVAAILSQCEVGKSGYPRKCKTKGLSDSLRAVEKQVGKKKLVAYYTGALSSDQTQRRALSAQRLSLALPFASWAKEAATQLIFERVVRAYGAETEALIASNLGHALAMLGSALRQQDAVVKAVKGHTSPDAREAGYKALWRAGNTSFLPALREALTQGDARTKKAVLNGFAYGSLRTKHIGEVCPLLLESMNHPDPKIGGLAATRAAHSCKADHQKVFAVTSKAIVSGRYTTEHVDALDALARRRGVPARETRKISGLLISAVKRATPAGDRFARSRALRSLKRVDLKAAKKISTRLKTDKDFFVRSEAQRILKS